MNTEMSTNSPLSLPPPSPQRAESTNNPTLSPPTPLRGMTVQEIATNNAAAERISHTDNASGEPLSSSTHVIGASRGTSSAHTAPTTLMKRSASLSALPSLRTDTTEETTGSPRRSLVRSPSTSSLVTTSTTTTTPTAAPSTQASPTGAGATPGTLPAGTGTTPGTPPAGAGATPGTPPAGAGATPGTPPAGAGATPGTPPPGAGATPGTGTAVRTLTVTAGTTTFAEIQTHATELNGDGIMPGSLLHQVKGHMETAYGNATISSRMTRDANDKYDLDIWDNRGTHCYKMDVTFVVSSTDAGGAVHEVTVTKTIYTNAVDPKQALQIIDAIKNAVVNSANGTDAVLQGESTFLLDFDKDKTGQFTGLKSIKGQTTNIGLTFPTQGPKRYTFRGEKIKVGEQHKASEVTYQSKSEMLQRGASYTIRGTGGRDVVMNRIAAKNLTVEAFVKDIEKKEKELEETRKKSFMRFNGLFGNRESSDVGTFKAYSEAFDAVSAAGGKTSTPTNPPTPTIPKTNVPLKPEWESIPKVKAYVDAHNAVVAKEAEKTTQDARVRTLADEVTTLGAQLSTASQAVNAHQHAFDEAQREDEETQRNFFAAQTALNRLPPSNIGEEESAERVAARNLVRETREIYGTAHTNFARIDEEHDRLTNELTICERNHRAKVEEHGLANALVRDNHDVTSAQNKFERIQRKFGGLSEKMSQQLAEFRREYDELVELKRTVDGMLANPVTRGTDTLSADDLTKLQETQARLAAIEANNRDLLEHLGLRATSRTQPIIGAFTPPT